MGELTRRDLVVGSAAFVAGRYFTGSRQEEKVGWAILGLGGYALGQIIPAFPQAALSRLSAVVSGDRAKAERVARENGLDPAKDAYTYESMDDLRGRRDVQVVYVITPPGTHREFTEQAARLGKHVCCEKPMAGTSADAQAMVEACRQAGVKLQIGYRSHYEAHSRRTIELLRTGELGKVLSVTSDHGFEAPRGTWRTDKELGGGGALWDIGIYAVQAACYLTNEDPTHVSAQTRRPADDERFREVDDQTHALLEFPGGAMANITSAYRGPGRNQYEVWAERGRVRAEPATAYGGHRFRVNGRALEVEPNNQFAAQMDHFSEAVQKNGPVLTPGEMGVRDIRILEAILKSAESGRREAV